jgi:hypothetical protein
MLHSSTTCHLNQPDDNLQLTGDSNNRVVIATGEQSRTTHQALLPMTQLDDPTQQTHILPTLHSNSLMSVKVQADNRTRGRSLGY